MGGAVIDDVLVRLIVAALIGAAWARSMHFYQIEQGQYSALSVWAMGVLAAAAAWEMLGAESAWWWVGAGVLAAVGAALWWELRRAGSSVIRLPVTYRFSYTDRDGHPTQRTVRVEAVGQWGGMRYFKGRCKLRDAERTFKADRVRGFLTDMDTGEMIAVDALFAGRKGLPRLDPTPAVVRRD